MLANDRSLSKLILVLYFIVLAKLALLAAVLNFFNQLRAFFFGEPGRLPLLAPTEYFPAATESRKFEQTGHRFRR